MDVSVAMTERPWKPPATKRAGPISRRREAPTATKPLVAAVAMGLLALAAPAAAQVQPAVDEVLDNGVRLVVVDRPALPLVTFALYLRGGLLLDRPPTFRHGSLAMGCLWMGHGDLDEDAVRRALDDLGADYGSSVDLQDTRVHLSCLAEHAAHAVELLAGAVLHPTFADAVVAREREQERRLLLQRSQQPEFMAQEAFVRAVVSDHELADAFALHDRTGALAGVGREAVVAAWRRMVQPQLATLFLVGPLPPGVLASARRLFGAWPRASEPTSIDVRAPTVAERPATVIEVPLPEMTQVYVQLGTLGPAPQASLAPAVHVLRLALAGGFTSSLEDELRTNRGLIYEITFSAPTLTFASPHSLTTQTRPDRVGEVLDVIAARLRAAAAGDLRPDQIEAAKNMWAATRALRREPQLGLADALYGSLRSFGDFDGWRRESSAVAAATPAQVAEVAARFDPSRLFVVLVGAPKDLAKIDWKPPPP